MKASMFKYKTQLYEINHLLETAHIQKAMEDGTYKPEPGLKFGIKERGHARYITSAATADKAVNHITCDEYLTPLLQKYLQYDNSSSQIGKGVAFHRHRFEIQLRKYYEREGTNEGYIGFSDFSGYYDNIVHEVALAQFSQYLAREIKDPEELADVMDKLRLAFRTFELDVSRFSDEEIEKMYHEKVRSTLNVGVPSSALTGEKMLRKGADIGNQVSQNTGIFLPVPIDNYVKIVCAVKGYGRYSDDFYIIDKSKEHLQEVMAGVRRWAAELGIIINEKKTRICKLSGQYRHLQVLYSLQEDGRIIRKISPKAITRERRKLKAYKRKIETGIMTYEEIENSYKSWICANFKYMSRQQIHNMTNLFKDLFGKEPTWKANMEKERTWTVALADGTLIENLTLGGNNFQSETEITADMFDGNLSEVHISASDGDMSGCAYPAVLHDAELVQITHDNPDGKWWFILRELSADELFKMRVQAQLDYLAMSADIDLEGM